MKMCRAQNGPFTERPYYELKDIEAMCIQELQGSGLYPQKPEPVRIDRFIEKRFNVVPECDDLEDGVLGLTVFGKKGVERIIVIVSKNLDKENTKAAERRIRYRQETLKNIIFFISLMPLIQAGRVNVIPDPMNFYPSLRQQIMAEAEKRRNQVKLDNKTIEPMKKLM